MRILLTGGAGFIGSHTAVELVSSGHQVACFDNLSNSNPVVMDRLKRILGVPVPLIMGDIRDRNALENVMREFGAEAVVHFAGLKAVGEAVVNPLIYFDNNVRGTLSLLEAMKACDIKTLVFSSSATVYGEPAYLPIDEEHPTSATNPYGRTKLMVEQILADVATADPAWRFAILRYFNPVGAHESGLIGEDPNGIPNNLMPFITKVATGRAPELAVYGADYKTHDGTGVRDYIHVTDLARGHVAAINFMQDNDSSLSTWNLGTGQGYSVIEMIDAFARTNGVSIPYSIVDRRPGDVAASYAAVLKAERELRWQAEFGLDDMCASAWKFARAWQR